MKYRVLIAVLLSVGSCTYVGLRATDLSMPPPPLSRALQAVVIGPTDAIGFNYSDADLALYVVTHFEASWDGQAFALTQATAVILPDTPAGATTYRVIPPFNLGTHSVTFRACRVEGCGGGSVPFDFVFPVINPVVPTGVRKIPR